MSTLTYHADTTVSLESQLERLALESNAIANVIATFKNIIPGLVAKLSDIAKIETDTTSDLVRHVKSEYQSLDLKLKYAKFGDYDRTLISVPEGFKGDILEYLKVMNRLMSDVYQGVQEMLLEYSTILGIFISNKDAKIDLSDYQGFTKRTAAQRQHLIESFQHWYPTGGVRSKTTLGSSLSRFSDIDACVQEVTRLDARHQSQNITSINTAVHRCVELLNILIDQTSHGEIGQVSGPAAQAVAVGAYEVASTVEALSVFRYRTMQIMTSVDQLVSQFNGLLK
jgi:hypothetical protein